MSQCRSCGTKIDWIKTITGKNMPLDPDYIQYSEAKQGDVLVTDGGVVYKVDHSKDLPSVKGRVSHFATCPDANNWRKK